MEENSGLSNMQRGLYNFLFDLFSKNEYKKELKHIPKYIYFIGIILAKQKNFGEFVPVSNFLLRRVLRQERIKKMKSILFHLGILECNFIKEVELVKGRIVGKTPYKYFISDSYFEIFRMFDSINIETSNKIDDESFEQTKGLLSEGTIYNRDGFSSLELDIRNRKEISEGMIYNRDGFSLPTDMVKRFVYLDKRIKIAKVNRWDELAKLQIKPEYLFIEKCLKMVSVSPFVDDALESMKTSGFKLKDAKAEFKTSDGRHIVYVKKDRVLNDKIFQQWRLHIEKIKNQEFKLSCPSSVNRVYHNVTLMPSVLRNFLVVGNEALVYLDFSNFQPFLFIVFLLKKFSPCGLPSDVSLFIDLTSKGIFYAEMRFMIQSKGIIIKNEETFKVDFFSRVFFSNEKVNYKYRVVFNEAFPNVSQLITEMKSDSYKNLSIQLQRLEAEIVINSIIRCIAVNYPEIFALPVHDAIICHESNSELVKNIMRDEVFNKIGYTPILKEENLSY